jgi:hypothetical protein
MNQQDALADALESFIGGQTLATFRDEAAKEMNGTCFKAMRRDGGRRYILLACVTGEHELRKIGDISGCEAQEHGDWSSVTLADALTRAIMRDGFCYYVDSSSRSSFAPVALIAAGPDSVTKLEGIFRLQP